MPRRRRRILCEIQTYRNRETGTRNHKIHIPAGACVRVCVWLGVEWNDKREGKQTSARIFGSVKIMSEPAISMAVDIMTTHANSNSFHPFNIPPHPYTNIAHSRLSASSQALAIKHFHRHRRRRRCRCRRRSSPSKTNHLIPQLDGYDNGECVRCSPPSPSQQMRHISAITLYIAFGVRIQHKHDGDRRKIAKCAAALCVLNCRRRQ